MTTDFKSFCVVSADGHFDLIVPAGKQLIAKDWLSKRAPGLHAKLQLKGIVAQSQLTGEDLAAYQLRLPSGYDRLKGMLMDKLMVTFL